MNRLTLFLIGFFVALSAFAGKVTEQEAMQKAQLFLQGKQFMQKKSLRRAPSTKKVSTEAYYIFNVEDKDGFVIVSGDDRLPDILAFSDKGNVDTKSLPCNMEWLLTCYENMIDSLDVYPMMQTQVLRHAAKRPSIEPLITTTWGQGAPYNKYCPEINGEKCPTGCVATAMAQIINYHKWPQSQTASIDAYITESSGINMPALEPTSFNWSNMTEDDIARLMLYCGQSAKMDYSLSGSGARQPCEALKTIFGYSKKAQNWLIKLFEAENLEQTVYDELSGNRPVFYTGYSDSKDSGHAFIVDGYKDGMFHINWGWNGESDGYFLITGLTEDVMPFLPTWSSDMIIGMEPPTLDAVQAEVIVDINFRWYGSRCVYRKDATKSFINSIPILNTLTCDIDGFTCYVGYGLYNDEGLLTVINPHQVTFPLKNMNIERITIESDIPIGTYKFIPVYRHSETDDWKKDVGSNQRYFIAHVGEQTFYLEDPVDNWNGSYKNYGVQNIDGVTYLLSSEFDNNWAIVLPYQVDGHYCGDVVIPNKLEYDDKSFMVKKVASDAFTDCNDLRTLSLAMEQNAIIYRCPNLTYIEIKQGNSVNVGDCPLIEELEFPQMCSGDVWNCAKLKSIRYTNILAGPSTLFSLESLPALTDIYLAAKTPTKSNKTGEDIPAYPNVILHVPKGTLSLYQASQWKNWNIVDDQPAPFVTWGYCHDDFYTGHGFDFNYGDIDHELAMRVDPADLQAYIGSKITHIEVYSTGRLSDNDSKGNDYEYVFITKRGTDYLRKQPFEIVRGAWNSIKLDEPYTITGEELFVGFGCHGHIQAIFSDMTYVRDAVWRRFMGNGKNEYDTPLGEWAFPGECPRVQEIYAHPLPLRFAIEGDNTPEGVVIRELEIAGAEYGNNSRTQVSQSRRTSHGGVTINGVIRNRSMDVVTSYTVEWSIDRGEKQSKTFNCHLIPNATKVVNIELPSITADGWHTVATNVTMVNDCENKLKDLNMPTIKFEIINGIVANVTELTGEETVLTAKNYTRVYGEDNPSFEYTIEGADLVGEPIITCEATATSPVGTYDIVVSQGTVSNNNVNYVAGTLTITKAPLKIAADTYTKKQGETMPEFTLSYNGFKNNETTDVLKKLPTVSCQATETSAPGEYPVVVSGAEAQNYEISYTAGKLVVTEADLVTITAKNYTRVYGEDNPTFEFTAEGTTLEGTPQISCEATADSPVGTYDIVVSQGTVSNYNVSYVAGTLTITKAPLIIAADTYTKKQGEAMPEFTLTYNGFKNNETKDVLTKLPTVSCEATEASAPGEYSVVVSGAEAHNYDISYTNGKLIVVDADAVIVKAKSCTREYGEDNPTFEYTVEGAELVGEPVITCEATATSPVGTYDIVVNQGTVSNYNVSYIAGTLTITKAPLTITAGTYTKKQYDPMPELKVSYDGFKNNETELVMTKRPVISCEANEESSPGEYDIAVGGAEALNYEIQYVLGKLTVTEPDSYSLTYMVDGEEYKSFTVKYRESIIPLDTPEKEGYTFSGWTEIPATMPAQDVVITGTFKVNTYAVTFMYNENVLKVDSVEYGAKITLPSSLDDERYALVEWLDVPETMPAHDITIYASITDGIRNVSDEIEYKIYDERGQQILRMKRGLNIIKYSNGRIRKVIVK